MSREMGGYGATVKYAIFLNSSALMFAKQGPILMIPQDLAHGPLPPRSSSTVGVSFLNFHSIYNKLSFIMLQSILALDLAHFLIVL
jgi:hypothetical protein